MFGNKKTSYGRDRGFTLLEVLVAVAILGVSLVTTMQLFGSCMKGISKAKQHSRAVFLAKKILDDDIKPLEVEYGETEGDFEEGFEGYKWKKNISKYEPEGENAGTASDKASSGTDRKISVKTAKITVTIQYVGDEDTKDILEISSLKTYFDSKEDD